MPEAEFAREVYLESYLAPLAPFLSQSDVTDIYVNRPGEVWVEALGKVPERFDVPELTGRVLARLARQIAAMNAQGISREHPLLSGALPDGSRVQVVLPPATRGEIALAIRRHVSAGLSLQDYHDTGAFAQTRMDAATPRPLAAVTTDDDDLLEVLRHAVRERRNILISGGTSTGKTTFLNALLQEVPQHERLILIEDTAELQIAHQNSVGLLAARGALGEADVSAEDLLIASLRMRPDRIILGEMRGREAMTFLRAVNTGHPGSMSTIHADTPERAIDQLALLILQSGANMEWEDVVRYVVRSVDLIVQLTRENGVRMVSRIWAPNGS
ncbi:type IV secretion system protein VirB11 [Novosphingobium sp. PhB165]|uniref:P-type DNA transfer ATPase VirB11 n=1 Tax=Novosphingobium sp. PhB165 TaxID=2485105 RepID=UPI001047C8F0|nr:P-type DNA transfer ATPase VirB11 [Novosphingobium sp. PhB165]TCM15078.1 type IV secretion system protein VirB11 [Novosphingobium sp. PhB165]